MARPGICIFFSNIHIFFFYFAPRVLFSSFFLFDSVRIDIGRKIVAGSAPVIVDVGKSVHRGEQLFDGCLCDGWRGGNGGGGEGRDGT